jgi:hypothetical protein
MRSAPHTPVNSCCGHLFGVVMTVVVGHMSCRMHGRLLLSEDVVRAAYPMRTCRPRGAGPIRVGLGEFQCHDGHSDSSRDSRKGTVCSDEASVFCYGHERGRLGKQNVARLDGYPQLALPVRTIKYLGIYRHEALLSALASRDRPRVRRTDGCCGRRLSMSQLLPTMNEGSVVRPCLNASPAWRPCTAAFLAQDF